MSTKPKRPTRNGPRTYENFPDTSVCPICGTNDDGECVLVPIYGTNDGHLCEGKPMHLVCAVAQLWVEEQGVGYIYGPKQKKG